MVSKLARKRSLCGDCIGVEASMTAVLRRNCNSSRHSLQYLGQCAHSQVTSTSSGRLFAGNEGHTTR
jgi:hypothetical protein